MRWMLGVVMLIVSGCGALLPPLSTSMTTEADLNVTIAYEGGFYTEVFDYAPDAPNVRHFVLVVPESEIARADPNWIFTSLSIQEDGSLEVYEGRQEYAWALDYIYAAPGGVFRGDFPPGTYGVSAAFVVAPLSREDAGVEGDVVAWPGGTGGGANTDLITVEIGEPVTLNFMMTDADGWACPWLYVFDGETYVRHSEILRNLRGPDNARTELTPLAGYTIVDGAIHLRIVEEKDEISTLDAFYLLVDGEPVHADDPRLWGIDGDAVIMHRGDGIDLRFPVDGEVNEVTVVAYGFYDAAD